MYEVESWDLANDCPLCGFLKVITALSKMYPKDMEAPVGGVDDMTKLSYLHEAGVLQNLATRYELSVIYADTGTTELVSLEMSKLTNTHVEETRKKIWLVDCKGLIVKSCMESLQHFKQPWAHEHELVDTLLEAVKIQADFILCTRCYVRGNYRPGLSSSDFKRVDIIEETKTEGTDKETLHLLEAVMQYGEDWKKVVEHVGSRSERECIARFIKLPFGEQFIRPEEGGF